MPAARTADLRPGPAQDPPQVRHHGQAHVAVDGDLGQRGRAQRGPDHLAVPGRGQPQQLLVAVGQMVVLVMGDHPDRPADVGAVSGVPEQRPHLLAGALLGDPAVRQVGDDVGLGELFLAPQPGVRQTDAGGLQPHGVVRVGGHGHRLQAPLAQQRGEDAPVLVLIRAVPGDLRRQAGLRAGHQRRDLAVLPPALGLAAGGDGAEQPERLVVVEDLPVDRPGGKHSRPPPVGGIECARS